MEKSSVHKCVYLRAVIFFFDIALGFSKGTELIEWLYWKAIYWTGFHGAAWVVRSHWVVQSHWRGWESSSRSVHQAGRISSPNLEDSWRNAGLCLRWKPREVGSNVGEGMPQQYHRWTCQPEWRQAGKKPNLPSFSLLLGLPPTRSCNTR